MTNRGAAALARPGRRTARPARPETDGQAGVALVEFAVLLPLALLLLTSMLEFGFAFNHNLTLEYATREGAQIGTALGDGTGSSIACGDVDAQVIAAAERVITAPGSQIALANISEVSIWKATASGTPTAGAVNTWNYSGPGTGPTVDGLQLGFTESSEGWSACTRTAGPPADSIGVSIKYTYQMVGPMAALLKFFGGSSAVTLPMSDQTVMAINPTE